MGIKGIRSNDDAGSDSSDSVSTQGHERHPSIMLAPIHPPTSNSQNGNNGELFTETTNAQLIRPSVEWIYPDGYIGPRTELGNSGAINVESVEHEVTVVATLSGELDSNTDILMVDPSRTTLIPAIEGEIVRPKRCHIKSCGIRICDDDFTMIINPWIFITILIFASAGGFLYSLGAPAQDQPEDLSVTTIPTMSPSTDMNITEQIFSLSGNATLDTGSPQNKALTWILNDSHDSTRLVQRYILMVFYYSMAGDKWTNNNGFGSAENECDWYGISCTGEKELLKFFLADNGLEGNLPNELGHLSNVMTINFKKNRISGSLPSTFGIMTSLNFLELEENNLSGMIPHEIRNCRNIRQFKIFSNRLSGTVPSFFGDLEYLHTVLLDKNQFTGTIPSELGMSRSLETLYIAENKLIKGIPSSLGNLSELKFLFLENNELTSTIPKELGMLPNLNSLSLSNNRLTGTIPEDLGSLSSMEQILLSNNRIKGTIPSSFDNLQELNVLELHENLITGELSNKLCELRFLTFTSDCAGSEAKVSCACCTRCY